VNEWKFPPTWADIKERIRSIERRPGAKPTEAPPQPEPLAPEDLLIPEWVKRWVYARFVLKPADLRPFRESYPEDVRRGNEPTAGWMPSGQYAEEAKLISDDMVRAKIAQVTGGAGLHPDTLKDLLGGA
jgi:hypothetical protein